MIELDSAPLPPARKAKAQTVVTASEWPKHVGERIHEAIAETGWTTGPQVKRYPTEGFTLLIGGAFNGQERDLRSYQGAKYIALPLDAGCVEWYERGDVSGYYWLASVTPQGIALRGTYETNLR